MFTAGDAIVHPARGVGIIERIEERPLRGEIEPFYRIKLVGAVETTVLVPVRIADEIGLRKAVSQQQLSRVWSVLRDEPQQLPDDHKERYEILEVKLDSGDVYRITEVVRDMTWREHQSGQLNTVGKRMHQRALDLLAGEVATALKIEVDQAACDIREVLSNCLAAYDAEQPIDCAPIECSRPDKPVRRPHATK